MRTTEKKGQSSNSFVSIVSAALLMAALSIAIFSATSDVATTYNQTINDSTFINISNSARTIVSITNNTANGLLGNQTSTTTTTPIDRTISSFYGSLVIIGQIGNVFVLTIEAVFTAISLPDYALIVVTFAIIVIVGLIIYYISGRQ